jgi:prepilin-type N-terminal cleavage/methylation domain-containing protein
MKTNTPQTTAGLENNCKRNRAFTLTELLVVLATLAILAAVVLPALAKSGDNSTRMVCLNNLRQLGTALNLYTGENQDYLPWPNWGNEGSPPCPRGWLYAGNCSMFAGDVGPPNLNNWSARLVAHLKGGVFWQYVLNGNVFICPNDLKPTLAYTSLWYRRQNMLSTYIMNGAPCFYAGCGNNNGTFNYGTCKASQTWSPSCIILWEPDQTIDAGCYNDGANYPGPDAICGISTMEGLGNLHGIGGNVLTVSGSAQCMTVAAYTNELSIPTKNRLFWNPLTGNGR